MEEKEKAKPKFDVIFCVLVYKNYLDLLDFIASVRDSCGFLYKIIVINSFFDEVSENAIKDVALNNDCVFINADNKGYGYGNNQGILYAISHFSFSFLVVSNPDILVKEMDYRDLQPYEKKCVVLGPTIICKKKKNQNPSYFRHSGLYERCIYQGLKKNNNLIFYFGIAVNVLLRACCPKHRISKIYGCHGSFIIFSREAIDKMFPIFDEKIFMFFEELDIAHKMQMLSTPCYSFPFVRVFHKEDGSIKLGNINTYSITKDSVMYVYKKWHSKEGR
jgi:GT2 family glycosyltransferase